MWRKQLAGLGNNPREWGTAIVKLISALLALMISSAGLAADGNTSQMTEDERGDAIAALGWQGPGGYALSASHSQLAVPDGYQVLVGADSRKLVTLTGNPANDSVEAVVFNAKSYDVVYFMNIAEGYVSVDDWGDVDPAAMLTDIKTNTEEANKERRAQGVAPLSVVGWLQEPTLDRATNTAYWAIEADDGKERYANSVALRLGRDGYEKLVWVTPKSTFVPTGGDLATMLEAHRVTATPTMPRATMWRNTASPAWSQPSPAPRR
jgi:uncharacterized membrane-anchored protein